MKFDLTFYGAEARILGMEYRRNVIYLSTLKKIAKEFNGKVPERFRGLVISHAADIAQSICHDDY